MNAKPDRQLTSIRLPHELYEALKEHAKRNGYIISGYICKLIRDDLDRERKKEPA